MFGSPVYGTTLDVMVKKIQTDLRVADCTRLSDSTLLLSLESDDILPDISAGQFAQLTAPGIFLRHPFSIHDVDMENGRLLFLVQIVGPATRALADLHPGERVNALLPLGNGFDLSDLSGRSLLVGGGVGIAPLLLLGRNLNNQNADFVFLFGGRTENQLQRIGEFTKYGPVHLSTQDGSAGETGLVTENSILAKETFDRIFCCGPTPMMKAVAAYAASHDIPCQVSLEHGMACGIGACLCCVEDTVDGNVCVCREGPVFDTKKLKWQI